jgi:hypothetical protein
LIVNVQLLRLPWLKSEVYAGINALIYVRMPNKLSGCRAARFLQAALLPAAQSGSAAESFRYLTKANATCAGS